MLANPGSAPVTNDGGSTPLTVSTLQGAVLFIPKCEEADLVLNQEVLVEAGEGRGLSHGCPQGWVRARSSESSISFFSFLFLKAIFITFPPTLSSPTVLGTLQICRKCQLTYAEGSRTPFWWAKWR